MPTETDKGSATADKLKASLEHARDALSERMLELGQKKTSPSDDATYNVIFTGKFTLEESQAITNMAHFFKMGNDSTRRMLQAGRVLKTYPNKAQADKLATMLKRGGAECRVEMEIPGEDDEPTPVQKAAFALQSVRIPSARLPDFHSFGRLQWAGLSAIGIFSVFLGLWLFLRPPTIHGDSAADFEASVERVVEHAGSQQASAVRKAILLLTESSRKAQNDSGTTNPDMAARLIYAPVKGKTADELLALAEARLEKQRAAYRQGIAEADQKIAAANGQLAEIAPGNEWVLDKITVISAAFGWPQQAPSPTLAFSIRNGSNESLMHLFLQGYLYDENGVLLVSNPVTYSVASGIEPGGFINAVLPTQPDSPWATAARGKNGLTLKVRVANAENRQGKALGTDYRPLETERQRQLDWKAKVQAQLDAVKL